MGSEKSGLDRLDQPSESPGSGPHVVVVGGGISGLAAAAALRTRGLTVTVLEGSPAIGGKLALGEVAGVTVDVGAEAMLNRRPEATELARRSGLAERLVHPATSAANLWSRGTLRPMPRTVMGVPADLRGLAAGGVVSRAGVARAALDLVIPPTRLEEDEDVSVAQLVERRLGVEVVERLVEPLLGGVYAGHARELSARAAVPQVVALLQSGRSLVRAAAKTVDAAGSMQEVPVFAGLVGGVGQLPRAVAASAGLDVRTDTAARRLTRRDGGGWLLEVGSAHAPQAMTAGAVVLATPAPSTARLLGEVAPDAAAELASVEYASMAVVTLALRAADLPETAGSGFLVPPVEGREVKAATYSFAKWDWVRAHGRESNDVLLLRCSIGRHREEHALQGDDAELVARVRAELSEAIGLVAQPVDTLVTRWGGALPQYAVGHVERVRRIRASLAREPGLAVCGAAYDGIGIAACVASAELAVTQVLDGLVARGE